MPSEEALETQKKIKGKTKPCIECSTRWKIKETYNGQFWNYTPKNKNGKPIVYLHKMCIFCSSEKNSKDVWEKRKAAVLKRRSLKESSLA